MQYKPQLHLGEQVTRPSLPHFPHHSCNAFTLSPGAALLVDIQMGLHIPPVICRLHSLHNSILQAADSATSTVAAAREQYRPEAMASGVDIALCISLQSCRHCCCVGGVVELVAAAATCAGR